MNATPNKPTLMSRMTLRWKLMLRSILGLWVKPRALPDADGNTGVSVDETVCYVMSDYALSSVLILDQVCEQLNLDRPLLPIPRSSGGQSRAYAVLKRSHGLLIKRPSTRRSSPVLRDLVETCCENPGTEIKLVPVNVFVGRAPDKETGIAKILFSEDWVVAGRFRRFLSTLFNGRDTVVQFSRPISLQQLASEELGSERSLRKVSRILRIHFRRVKTAAIGPDLSHRRTVVDGVIKSPVVKKAIEEKARRDKVSIEKATKMARKYATEIAANYSYSFVRIAFFIINWFVQRIYQGVFLHHVDPLKRKALDHAVVYVPCHRSHADYVLLSYMLYQQGLVPPHVAAGLNLNLPVLGSLLRMGGAFYLRRSFRSKKLYSAVFSQYVAEIMAQGVSIEYFIEGTRSRTGRLLAPKGGMLVMTVRAFLSAPSRPVMFQPVYVGYEKLTEGSSYASELSGTKKKKESLGGFLGIFRILKKNYGEVHLSFGEPIMLESMLDEYAPDWRETTGRDDDKPGWLTPMVNELGNRILRRINATADVNAINLVALVLLAAPRHAAGEFELESQIDLYRALLESGIYDQQVTLTRKDATEIVAHAQALGFLERTEHVLGDIIRVLPDQAVGLTYYRNNVAHLLAVPSLIACCFLHQRRMSREQLLRIAEDVYPFLRTELFLPWEENEFPVAFDRCIRTLIDNGLLTTIEDGQVLDRGEGSSVSAGQLTLLARGLLPTLERFYIAVAVLDKNGSGVLSREALERLCFLTAQRISLVQEFDSPEFYDRNLFRQFIAELRRLEVLVSNNEGKLEFEQHLGRMGKDSRLFLHKEIRHSIARVAPSLLDGTVDQSREEA